MSDPGDGPVGHVTRGQAARVPGQRRAEPDGARPPGGRAAARAAHARGGSRGRRRARPVRRGRRALKIAAICLSVLTVATAGAGWWFYQHLNGNIHSVALDGKGGAEKADAFGRTPINILVMGSDGRTSKADCKLGGGCSRTGVQSGSNADVEMVVHISADRSNATVMSIPRDTMTNVPACKDSANGTSTPGYYGQINSALQYGPACQVATVHRLTGIPIDHFVKLDFSGVVKMSDAVGGVSVCVSDNVYDTYSHLKLAKGTHTLQGDAALEFVRSRHGFGDGSDLGRTVSQHLFLSAMIRKFKSAGTLTDPGKVYSLADAATKALTVDTGLGSVTRLVDLATDLNKVPSKRMTFTTMQTAADPTNANRVVPAASAKSLFATIANDQSLTSDSGTKKKSSASPSASAGASASCPPARLPVPLVGRSPSAWSRSAHRSSTSSRPTDIRSSRSPTPAPRRSSASTMRWLIDAGCWMRVSTLPRLTAGVIRRTAAMTSCGSPAVSKAIIAPPMRG